MQTDQPNHNQADEAGADLKSQGGSLTAQVQIIRKETGVVENYTLTFTDTVDAIKQVSEG